MIDRIDRFIRKLAAGVAILGGVALIGIVLSSVISIAGRAMIPLGLGPIPGDFELVQLGTGFAIFAFMPWCQISRQHATVEVLTMQFSDAVNRWIDLASDLLMFAAATFIAWRHYEGMLDKMRYGETTFIIQYPVWWAYATGLLGGIVFVIVSAHCVALSLRALATGVTREPGEGAVH